MQHQRTLVRWVVSTTLCLGCASANAFITYIDEFRIVRSGATFFLDTFDDGVEPPIVPNAFNCAAAPSCYSLSGTFNTDDEAGGKLRMNTALGGEVESAIGNPRIFQRASLLSNRSDLPADMNAGLKRHRVFSASVVYDLVVPGPADQMQVRLADPHANTADPGHRSDTLSLAVRRDDAPGAMPVIRFFEQNFNAGTLTEIDSTPLNLALGADQIRLTLAHSVADSTEIFAAWDYLSGGGVVASGSFATPGNIFDGETFTRADFGVSAMIPEPETYAMLLAGIGVLVWRLRGRRGPKMRANNKRVLP